VDTETDGLNPFKNEIILIQVGNTEKQWVIDNRVIAIEPLKPYLEATDIVKLGQHLQFDWKFLALQDMRMQNLADTMLAEQVLRCGLGMRVNMQVMAKHYLRIDIAKDDDLRQSFKDTPVGELTEEQLKYAAGDCIYPVYIAKHQKPLIKNRGLRNTLSLEHAVLPILAQMELAGMRIDQEAWTKLYQEAIASRGEAELRLDKLFGCETLTQEDFFGEAKKIKSINYGSPAQVKKAFIDHGYPVENTDAKDLAYLAIMGDLPRELVQALIAWRIYNKRATTYGLNFFDAIEAITGHLHTDFTQAFTTSGRLSSGQKETKSASKKKKTIRVNFQNIPKNNKYRSCFVPDEGDVFIIYDFKAIEPRILGDMSLDPTYIEAFAKNKDIYAIIGQNIYGEPVSKKPGRESELRDKAKIGVLGTSYGTGKDRFFRTLVLDLNVDDEGFLKDDIVVPTKTESDDLWEGIFQTCPVIRESLDKSSDLANPIESERVVFDERAAEEPYQMAYERVVRALSSQPRADAEKNKEKARKRAAKRGYVTFSTSLNGRKRFFKCYHATWWTDGRNHPIQATAGGDIIKTAMVDIDARIKKEGHDAAIINQVHDELILRCKKEHAPEVDKYVKELMERAGNKFLRVVPCIVEGGIKDKWEK
jgi:DNA polymerase-1